jgi:hypothetical protein
MSLTELLPAIRELSRDEKRELLTVLSRELSANEVGVFFPPGAEFPIWSPHDSYEAAAMLQRLLDEQKARAVHLPGG